MQENHFSVFFKMRNYLTKFFLICEIVFDFFNKFANKLRKFFHVAKFVRIFFKYAKFFEKIFALCIFFHDFLENIRKIQTSFSYANAKKRKILL